MSTSQPMDRVEAWTVSQAATLLSATSTTPSSQPRASPIAPLTTLPIRGTTQAIQIPLDELPGQLAARPRKIVHTVYGQRQRIQRDSQKSREAILKGKEGSRQRRRWENDRLLNNPHASRPDELLPEDWQVRPTHPVHHVPYFLAPLWDAEYARLNSKRKEKEAAAKKPASREEATVAKMTQELRAKLKKARGAKGLLQDLEQEVRGFIEKWDQKQKQLESEGLIEPDSEDEEIVFVGRNGAMSDEQQRRREDESLEKDKLIFQGLVDDHGAAFGRYLVHSIAQYYGLKTWSVTRGNSREAYVGLKTDPVSRRPSLSKTEMPRPLWTVV